MTRRTTWDAAAEEEDGGGDEEVLKVGGAGHASNPSSRRASAMRILASSKAASGQQKDLKVKELVLRGVVRRGDIGACSLHARRGGVGRRLSVRDRLFVHDHRRVRTGTPGPCHRSARARSQREPSGRRRSMEGWKATGQSPPGEERRRGQRRRRAEMEQEERVSPEEEPAFHHTHTHTTAEHTGGWNQ